VQEGLRETQTGLKRTQTYLLAWDIQWRTETEVIRLERAYGNNIFS